MTVPKNISVIITTYNRPDMLLKVLEAFQCQTVAPDEVIVADDGSDSDTTTMLSGFRTSGFPFDLIHVWHEDRGFRAAEIRNKAILRSGGQYIISVDGDCIPDRHFIADHIKLAEPGCFFQGKRVIVGRRLSSKFTHLEIETQKRLLRLLFARGIGNRHHLVRLPFFPAFRSRKMSGLKTCNMGFFREDIFAVNGFNQDFVGWGREDSELAVRFYKYGLKRKGHPFMAICFHLWHRQNDRSHLTENDEYLRKTMASDDYICANGLVPQTKR